MKIYEMIKSEVQKKNCELFSLIKTMTKVVHKNVNQGYHKFKRFYSEIVKRIRNN